MSFRGTHGRSTHKSIGRSTHKRSRIDCDMLSSIINQIIIVYPGSEILDTYNKLKLMFANQGKIVNTEIDTTSFIIILLSIVRYYCEDEKHSSVKITEVSGGSLKKKMRGGIGIKFIKQFFAFLLLIATTMMPVRGVLTQTREKYVDYIKDMHDLSRYILHNDLLPGKCLANALFITGVITNLDDYQKLSLQHYAHGVTGDITRHPSTTMFHVLKHEFITAEFKTGSERNEWKTALLSTIIENKDSVITTGYITTILLTFPSGESVDHAVGISIYLKDDGEYILTIIDTGQRLSRKTATFSSENIDVDTKLTEFDRYINDNVWFAAKRKSFITFTKSVLEQFDFKTRASELKDVEDSIYKKLLDVEKIKSGYNEIQYYMRQELESDSEQGLSKHAMEDDEFFYLRDNSHVEAIMALRKKLYAELSSKFRGFVEIDF